MLTISKWLELKLEQSEEHAACQFSKTFESIQIKTKNDGLNCDEKNFQIIDIQKHLPCPC